MGAEIEAGEAFGSDLVGQFGFPAQIGLHRVAIAGVTIVVPEQIIDALRIGRIAGRRDDRKPDAGPRWSATGSEHDPCSAQFGEVEGGKPRRGFVGGEYDDAGRLQGRRGEPTEPRANAPGSSSRMRLPIGRTRFEADASGTLGEKPCRLCWFDLRHGWGRCNIGYGQSGLKRHAIQRAVEYLHVPAQLLQPMRGHDRARPVIIDEDEARAASPDPSVDRLDQLAARRRNRAGQVAGGEFLGRAYVEDMGCAAVGLDLPLGKDRAIDTANAKAGLHLSRTPTRPHVR